MTEKFIEAWRNLMGQEAPPPRATLTPSMIDNAFKDAIAAGRGAERTPSTYYSIPDYPTIFSTQPLSEDLNWKQYATSVNINITEGANEALKQYLEGRFRQMQGEILTPPRRESPWQFYAGRGGSGVICQTCGEACYESTRNRGSYLCIICYAKNLEEMRIMPKIEGPSERALIVDEEEGLL